MSLVSMYYYILNEFQHLEAEDAKRIYPKEYTMWRQDPSSFNVNGVYPVRQLWDTAKIAWKEILFTPVRTHSSFTPERVF